MFKIKQEKKGQCMNCHKLSQPINKISIYHEFTENTGTYNSWRLCPFCITELKKILRSLHPGK
jgi:hypothetical protein